LRKFDAALLVMVEQEPVLCVPVDVSAVNDLACDADNEFHGHKVGGEGRDL